MAHSHRPVSRWIEDERRPAPHDVMKRQQIAHLSHSTCPDNPPASIVTRTALNNIAKRKAAKENFRAAIAGTAQGLKKVWQDWHFTIISVGAIITIIIFIIFAR